MTSQQHPITPSKELEDELCDDFCGTLCGKSTVIYIATRAAQWGADAELKACCALISNSKWHDETKNLRGPFRAAELRATRRPKPPSLAEEALSHFESYAATFETSGGDSDLVRRALERLQELEGGQ